MLYHGIDLMWFQLTVGSRCALKLVKIFILMEVLDQSWKPQAPLILSVHLELRQIDVARCISNGVFSDEGAK